MPQEGEPEAAEPKPNDWFEKDGQKYYYDANGEMLKGMQPIGGKWYYFDTTTGALWTGGWKQVAAGWFWSGADGVIPYGLNYIEGTWRYIDPNTGYLRVGFIDVC